MLRKIVAGLVVLLLLAVAAVLVLPSFVDWNAYRARIAQEVEAATGRSLTIAGDVGLSILPSPRLTAAEVRLANLPGGQAENLAELEALEVKVALAPLLTGEVVVRSVVLVAPTVTLERLPDGRGNWQFAAPGDATGTPPQTAEPAPAETAAPADPLAAPQPSAESAPDASPSESGSASGSGSGPAAEAGLAIRLDAVSIERGTVIYRDLASGTEERVEALDAEVSAGSLQGPFQAEGTARARGQPLAFAARSGRLDGGATPLALDLNLAEAGDATVTFSGTLDAAATALEGELQAEGENLALLAEALAAGRALPSQLAADFGLDGNLRYAGSRLTVSDLQLSLGGITAQGDAELDLAPQVEGRSLDGRLALNVARLDLDALLADPLGGGGGQTQPQTQLQTQTQTAGDGGAPAFALPGDMALGVELLIDALVYRGEVVRQVLLSGRLADGAVTLDQALALLPAGGDLSLAGRLTAQAGAPRFVGSLEAASDNLRGLADWLALELPPVPNDRLRRASLSSGLDVTPERARFSDLVLEIDSTTLRGGLDLALGQAKPAFGAGLTVDRLNLDAYLPGSGGGGGPLATQVAQSDEAANESGGAAGGSAAARNPLDAFNANLHIVVGSLTYRGQQAGDISLQAQVRDAVVTVQALEVGDLVGGSGRFAGVLAGLPDAPELREGQFRVEVPDTARLARLLGQPAGGPLAGLGRLSAEGQASGSAGALRADLSARISEGSLSFAGQVADPLGAPALRDGQVALDLSGTRRLAALAGLGDSPLARLGPVALSGPLSGTAEDLRLDLSGTLLGGQVGAAGRLLTGARLAFEDLRLTARGVAGARLAELIGPAADQLAGLGALDLDTTVSGSPDGELSYDTRLGLLGGELRGRGTASGLTGAQMSYAFDAAVELPQLRRLLGALDLPPSLREGVGLSAQARLSGTPLRVEVADLSGTLGPTSLAGRTTLDMTGARPDLQAELQFGQLALDRLLDDSLSGGGGQSSRWSREPLGLEALSRLTAQANVTAESISRGQFALRQASLPLSLDNAVLRVAPLTGTAAGGNLRLELTLDARDPAAAALEFAATGSRLDSAQLVPADSPAGGRVSGPLDIEFSGRSRGASEAQLVGNLAGQGRVGGQLTLKARGEEAVGNLLLGILGQQIKELRGLSDTVNTVFNAFAGAPAELSGSFDIAQGVVRTDDLTLVGRNAVARSQGVAANLPDWGIDLRTDLYRGEEQQPYLTAVLRGALDDPDVRVSGQPFQRDRAPAPAEGQSDDQPAGGQTAPEGQPQEPRSPEEVLRDQGKELLRGLFKNLQQ